MQWLGSQEEERALQTVAMAGQGHQLGKSGDPFSKLCCLAF